MRRRDDSGARGRQSRGDRGRSDRRRERRGLARAGVARSGRAQAAARERGGSAGRLFLAMVQGAAARPVARAMVVVGGRVHPPPPRRSDRGELSAQGAQSLASHALRLQSPLSADARGRVHGADQAVSLADHRRDDAADGADLAGLRQPRDAQSVAPLRALERAPGRLYRDRRRVLPLQSGVRAGDDGAGAFGHDVARMPGEIRVRTRRSSRASFSPRRRGSSTTRGNCRPAWTCAFRSRSASGRFR